MKRIAFGFGIGVVLAGCSAGSGGEGKGLEAGAAQVGEGVLSTVDGRPISVQRVQELVAATGLGPKEAVRRLQAEELLASEAKRRGFGDLPEVRMVGRRAAAQKLLEVVVEEPNGPKTFSDDRIRDEYETMKPTRFVLPERRTSVHFLAKIPEDASPELEGKAKALAEAEVAALRKATDLKAYVAATDGKTIDGIRIYAQFVPPMAEDASADPEYLRAMFALSKPGLVEYPVRSVFGWHAILVTDILPAKTTPLEEAAPEIRKDLVLPARKAAVDDLLKTLAEQGQVSIDAEAMELATQAEFKFEE